VRLAECGCSAHEIMSITGHKSLALVQHYTQEVEQMKLSRIASKRTVCHAWQDPSPREIVCPIDG